MLTDMSLGQYFPGNSLLHRLDPRTKVLLTILYIVTIFLAHSVWCYALLVLSAIVLIAISRIPFKVVLRGVRPVLVVLVFTAVINLFFTGGKDLVFEVHLIPVWDFAWLRMYWEGVYRAIAMTVRVIVLVIGSFMFLTYTTSPITLTDALESLLSPLRIFRIPVHDFAMLVSIALRFIPTLMEETDKIMNAQKARGADFASGGLIKRVRALVPVLIPLLVSSIKRAEELATAMECRCYRGGKGRTKLHRLKFHARDFVTMGVFALFCAVIVLGNLWFPQWIPFGFSV